MMAHTNLKTQLEHQTIADVRSAQRPQIYGTTSVECGTISVLIAMERSEGNATDVLWKNDQPNERIEKDDRLELSYCDNKAKRKNIMKSNLNTLGFLRSLCIHKSVII